MAHRICERCGARMNPQMIRKVFRYNKEDIGVDCEGFVCEECGGIVFASDEFRRIDSYIRAAYPLKRPTMTNADKIRAMTDKELAKWLCDLAWAFPRSEKGWLDWLKQEGTA